MPHILQEFSKCCDTEISTPEIHDHFFPITFEKYIVIACGNKKQSMSYIYWLDVFDMLKKTLRQKEIKVIQINQHKFPHLEGTDLHLQGLPYTQIAYILKHAEAVVSANGLFTHMASAYGVPVVSLHGENYPSSHGPYWGDNNINLHSFTSEIKPSFSDQDEHALINKIKPEEVASSVLSVLDIKQDLGIKSLFFGGSYPNSIIEVCPNFFNPNLLQPKIPLNIRLDWHLDLQNALNWIKNRKVNIFLNEEIDFNFFKAIKNNVNQVNFYVNEDSNLNYLRDLQNLGIQISLTCTENADINQTRLHLIDYIVEENPITEKKDLDFVSEICNNTYYKSSKTIISNNEHYNSKFSMLQNIPKNGPYEKVVDSPEFWRDKDYYFIFNKNDA